MDKTHPTGGVDDSALGPPDEWQTFLQADNDGEHVCLHEATVAVDSHPLDLTERGEAGVVDQSPQLFTAGLLPEKNGLNR